MSRIPLQGTYKLSYAKMREIRQLLESGNENYSGDEIWDRLFNAGYCILPIPAVLQLLKENNKVNNAVVSH